MSLEEKQREPAEVTIRLGPEREEMLGFYAALNEVVVELSRNAPSVATLVLESRRDEQGKWSIQDEELLVPWQSILIEAKFGHYSEEVMRGYIRQITVDYPDNAGDTSVIVECIDDSLMMDREQVRRDWGADSPVDDSVILQELAGKYSLSVSSESGNGQNALVLLQNSTDNRFLRMRAEANGFEFIVSQGEIYFGPMRLDGDPQETIFVYSGESTSCNTITIEDNGHKPDKVGFDFIDPEQAGLIQEIIESDLSLLGETSASSTTSGLNDFVWMMDREAGVSQEELRARAQMKANENAMKIKARGELDGTLYGHVLLVAKTVQVDGTGQRYGGVYYVDQVTHTFRQEGYRQQFVLLRNAYGNNLSHSEEALTALL